MNTTTSTRPYRITAKQSLAESFTYQNVRYTIALDKNGKPSIGLTLARFKNNLTGGHIVEQFAIIEGMRIGLSQVELTQLRNSL